MPVKSRPDFPTPNPLPSFTSSGPDVELISPTSVNPCPRISRISSSSYNLRPFAAPSPRPAATHNYQLVSEGYPSPVPSLTYDTYSSSSPQSRSINTTPQSSYSDLSDERPRQRRRIMSAQPAFTEAYSEFKIAEPTCNRAQGKKGRKSRKREV